MQTTNEQSNFSSISSNAKHPIAVNDSLLLYQKNNDLYIYQNDVESLLYSSSGSIRDIVLHPTTEHLAILEYLSGEYALSTFNFADDSARVIHRGSEYIYSIAW